MANTHRRLSGGECILDVSRPLAVKSGGRLVVLWPPIDRWRCRHVSPCVVPSPALPPLQSSESDQPVPDQNTKQWARSTKSTNRKNTAMKVVKANRNNSNTCICSICTGLLVPWAWIRFLVNNSRVSASKLLASYLFSWFSTLYRTRSSLYLSFKALKQNRRFETTV